MGISRLKDCYLFIFAGPKKEPGPFTKVGLRNKLVFASLRHFSLTLKI